MSLIDRVRAVFAPRERQWTESTSVRSARRTADYDVAGWVRYQERMEQYEREQELYRSWDEGFLDEVTKRTVQDALGYEGPTYDPVENR